MACPKPLAQKRSTWQPVNLSLSAEGDESLSLNFAGDRGIARDGFGKPIAILQSQGERLWMTDLKRSPFCSVVKGRAEIAVFDADHKPLLTLRQSAQGLTFEAAGEKRVMKHEPGGTCFVVGTAIRGAEHQGGVDVDQGSAPLFSALGASCFAALTLSLNELPFMQRLCVFVAAENVGRL